MLATASACPAIRSPPGPAVHVDMSATSAVPHVSLPQLRRLWLWLIVLCGVLANSVVTASVELLPVRPGLIASANYSPGRDDRPPVLLLHGFLQTANFFTIKRLHANLAEQGYPVLSPTLTLGITQRAQSLDCEALHLHNLQQDVQELRQWVEWLTERHSQPMVLIGHSAAGLVISRYLSEGPHSQPAATILISPKYLRGDQQTSALPPDSAVPKIGTYPLGFCNRYPTTPQAYRSYVEWDSQRLLNALQQMQPLPAIVLGSADDRLQNGWAGKLLASGLPVHQIEGANHFFDSTHELDLLEAIETLLDD